MRSVRVAFAGLSPLCEDIFRAALARRPDIEFVSPWTRLSSLGFLLDSNIRELLVVELDERTLPRSLHALLATAPNLSIIGISADARAATVFRLSERKTLFLDCSAEQLCTVLDYDDA